MFLQNVISFYKRLVKDKDFRSQLESTANPSECRKIMQEAGYDFTQEEFETATVQILEKNGLRDLDDGLTDLSEEDLELAFGGISQFWGWRYKWPKDPIIQPLYGVVYQPPEDETEPKPDPVWEPQPLYGVVIDPPEAIAHYGIVVSNDQLLS
jgi:predicted ribosomally synthesized peptide with nif11-like leader